MMKPTTITTATATRHSFLTHAHLRDTCTILKPAFWHLFPGWGAALTSHAPHVLANCQQYNHFRYNNNHNQNDSGNKSLPFFFQAHAKAPWQLIRRKSSPVAYLTPERLAVLWADLDAHRTQSNNSQRLMDEKALSHERRQRLAQVGVNRSNHVDDVWTGVSLARWMALFAPAPIASVASVNPSQSWLTNACTYTPLYSAALWQMSHTKKDLWDFWMAYEQQMIQWSASYSTSNTLADAASSSSFSILNPRHPLVPALREDEAVHQEWMESAISSNTADDTSMDDLRQSLDLILQLDEQSHTTTPSNNNNHDNALPIARALEVVCAHTAVQPMAQPPVPNGRYGFEGGAEKPDCVEVAVREVMNLLLWNNKGDHANSTNDDNIAIPPVNERQGHYDVERLSFLHHKDPTTSEKQLTAKEEQKESINTDVIRFYQQQNEQLRQSSMGIKSETEMPSSLTSKKDDASQWFHMLQNLPHCQYLSRSPLGNPYELTPTLHNISSVIHQLLGGTGKTERWTSLKDLERAWNDDSERSLRPKLHVTTRKVSHRPALADEMVHHEFATMYLENANNGIELKLDKAHAIATVSHFKRRRMDNHPFHDTARLSKLRELTNTERPVMHHTQAPLRLLSVLLNGDSGLEDSRYSLQSTKKHNDGQSTCTTPQLLLDLLSVPYGSQRRNLMELNVTSDLNMELQAYKKATRESLSILECAVLRACQTFEHKELAESQQEYEKLVAILLWLLNESPMVSLDPSLPERHQNSTGFALPDQEGDGSTLTDEIWQSLIFNPQVESALIRLPPSVLLQIMDQVDKGNQPSAPFWASRHPHLLRKLAEWKLGDLSMGDLVAGILREKPRELLTLLALMVKSGLSGQKE